MKFKIHKSYILWQLRPGFNLFYLWWGLEPWYKKTRDFEFGIGPYSWLLFQVKV